MCHIANISTPKRKNRKIRKDQPKARSKCNRVDIKSRISCPVSETHLGYDGLRYFISVPCITFGLSLGPAPPGACDFHWHLYHIPDISNSLESLLKLDAHSHNVIHLHCRTFLQRIWSYHTLPVITAFCLEPYTALNTLGQNWQDKGSWVSRSVVQYESVFPLHPLTNYWPDLVSSHFSLFWIIVLGHISPFIMIEKVCGLRWLCPWWQELAVWIVISGHMRKQRASEELETSKPSKSVSSNILLLNMP